MLTGDSYAKEAAAWRKEHALIPISDVQAFFEKLAAEIAKPTFGDIQKKYMENVLLRAIEAGIYNPKAD